MHTGSNTKLVYEAYNKSKSKPRYNPNAVPVALDLALWVATGDIPTKPGDQVLLEEFGKKWEGVTEYAMALVMAFQGPHLTQ